MRWARWSRRSRRRSRLFTTSTADRSTDSTVRSGQAIPSVQPRWPRREPWSSSLVTSDGFSELCFRLPSDGVRLGVAGSSSGAAMNAAVGVRVNTRVLAILSICATAFFLASHDALAKRLTMEYPIALMVWVRYLVHFLVMAATAAQGGRRRF